MVGRNAGLSRPLSRHERYSLVRRQIGTPSVLTYVVTFQKAATSVPTLQDLRLRIALLCQQHPVLRSRVLHATTNKPVLQALPFDENTAYARVVEQSIRLSPETNTAQGIFQLCIRWAATFNVETGDLWRVGRIVNETNGEIAIVLCADHIVGDGRGTLGLLVKLLDDSFVSIEGQASLPPALEDRVNVRPVFSTLAKAIIQAILLPKLPRWIVPEFFKPTTFWPYDAPDEGLETSLVVKPALQAETGILVSQWCASQVRQMQSAMRKHEPSITVQGMISGCAMVALWINEVQTWRNPMDQGTRIRLTTPTSERNMDLGHSDILGNYVGAVDTDTQLSSDSKFLQIIIDYTAHLHHQVTNKLPPTTWGMLDYIDDPDTSAGEEGLNGWTHFFLQKARSREPYSGSLEVSNLGLAPLFSSEVQRQVRRVDWMQTPTAVGSALAMNVVGYKCPETLENQGDISFSVVWRRDSVGRDRLSESFVETFVTILKGLPDIIAKEMGKRHSVTLEDLRNASQLSMSTLV